MRGKGMSEPTFGDAGGVAPSLVNATFLDTDSDRSGSDWWTGPALTLNRQEPEGWCFTLSPDAGEGGGSFRGVQRSRSGLFVPAGEASDPERAPKEAARRARGRVRRFCAAH